MEERAQQVVIMAAFYRSAKQTVVWLDPEMAHSALGFEYLLESAKWETTKNISEALYSIIPISIRLQFRALLEKRNTSLRARYTKLEATAADLVTKIRDETKLLPFLQNECWEARYADLVAGSLAISAQLKEEVRPGQNISRNCTLRCRDRKIYQGI
jgi:hypothetical protein